MAAPGRLEGLYNPSLLSLSLYPCIRRRERRWWICYWRLAACGALYKLWPLSPPLARREMRDDGRLPKRNKISILYRAYGGRDEWSSPYFYFFVQCSALFFPPSHLLCISMIFKLLGSKTERNKKKKKTRSYIESTGGVDGPLDERRRYDGRREGRYHRYSHCCLSALWNRGRPWRTDCAWFSTPSPTPRNKMLTFISN